MRSATRIHPLKLRHLPNAQVGCGTGQVFLLAEPWRYRQAAVPLSRLRRGCSTEMPKADLADVAPPTSRQLRTHWLNCAVPMVGFGMMDNFVMIQAGDLIDNTIGVSLGLATLTAAACGQVFSDVSGVLFGGVIERIAEKLGLPASGLTTEQLQLRFVKYVGLAGAVAGVTCGCLLGMTSLFFMDLEKAERMKRLAQLETLFDTVMSHGRNTVKAEWCALWLVEGDGTKVSTHARMGKTPSRKGLVEAFELWDTDRDGLISRDEIKFGLTQIQRPASDDDVERALKQAGPKVPNQLDFEEFARFISNHVLQGEEGIQLPLSKTGIKGRVAESRQILNIPDMEAYGVRSGRFDRFTGLRVKSTLMCPVFGSEGKLLAIVEMTNKQDAEGNITVFTKEDERLVEMLAVHAALFIERSME